MGNLCAGNPNQNTMAGGKNSSKQRLEQKQKAIDLIMDRLREDRNQDQLNELTEEDYVDIAKQYIKIADQDGDEKLDQNEFEKFILKLDKGLQAKAPSNKLEDWFSEIDTDKNGKLDAEEFGRGIKKIVDLVVHPGGKKAIKVQSALASKPSKNTDSKQFNKIVREMKAQLQYTELDQDTCVYLVQKFMDEYDTDTNGKLDFDEFKFLMQKLSKTIHSDDDDIRKEFDRLDTDKSGFLEKEELSFAIKFILQDGFKKSLTMDLNVIDIKDDDEDDKKEKRLENLKNNPVPLSEYLENYPATFGEESIDDIWTTHDEDQNGFLDRDEARKFLDHLLQVIKFEDEREVNKPEENFDDLFDKFDENGDNFLSRAELAVFIKKTFA